MDSANASGSTPLAENEMCHAAKPEAQHEWLQQLVGEWESSMEMVMGPGQEPLRSTGRETVRSLGGLWTIGEGSGEMPDGDLMQSVMTLGFDTARGRFVGTFVASMMTFMWVYDGQLSGNVLTLDCQGPAMEPIATPGTLASYQDIIEITGPDTRTLRSQVKGADGQWVQFMEAKYKRVG